MHYTISISVFAKSLNVLYSSTAQTQSSQLKCHFLKKAYHFLCTLYEGNNY